MTAGSRAQWSDNTILASVDRYTFPLYSLWYLCALPTPPCQPTLRSLAASPAHSSIGSCLAAWEVNPIQHDFDTLSFTSTLSSKYIAESRIPSCAMQWKCFTVWELLLQREIWKAESAGDFFFFQMATKCQFPKKTTMKMFAMPNMSSELLIRTLMPKTEKSSRGPKHIS